MAIRLGDLVLTGGDRADDRSAQRDASAGRLLRVAEGVYVTKGRRIAEVLRGQWAPLLAKYAPGAVLAGRSALRKGLWTEHTGDTSVAWLFASNPNGKARRRFSLPGLEIRTVPGAGAMEGDVPFLGVFLASDARCLLDNLVPSRSREGPSRTAGREAVEVEVDRLFSLYGDDGMRELRRRAEALAPALDAREQLASLHDIIGAVAGLARRGLLRRRSPLADGQPIPTTRHGWRGSETSPST